MAATLIDHSPIVYFHRELPPLDADVIGVHTVEATSAPVSSALVRGGALWTQCYDDLIASTCLRIEQEVARLGGQYARVYEESIDVRRDDATGKAWLHGRFDYVLYRRLATSPPPAPLLPTNQADPVIDLAS